MSISRKLKLFPMVPPIKGASEDIRPDYANYREDCNYGEILSMRDLNIKPRKHNDLCCVGDEAANPHIDTRFKKAHLLGLAFV